MEGGVITPMEIFFVLKYVTSAVDLELRQTLYTSKLDSRVK